MKTISILVIFGALALASAQRHYHYPGPSAPAPAPAPSLSRFAASIPAISAPMDSHPTMQQFLDYCRQLFNGLKTDISQMDISFHNWMNSMMAPPPAPLG